MEPVENSRWGSMPTSIGPPVLKKRGSSLLSIKVQTDFDTKSFAMRGGIITVFKFPTRISGNLNVAHMGNTSDSLFVVRSSPTAPPPEGMRFVDSSSFKVIVNTSSTGPTERYLSGDGLVYHHWTISYNFTKSVKVSGNASKGRIAWLQWLDADTCQWIIDSSSNFECKWKENCWALEVQELEGESEWAIMMPILDPDDETIMYVFPFKYDANSRASAKPTRADEDDMGSNHQDESDDDVDSFIYSDTDSNASTIGVSELEDSVSYDSWTWGTKSGI